MYINSHLQEIKKSITFIFIKDAKGNYHANGTGFFVGIKTSTDKFIVYLFTSKHVLQDAKVDFLKSQAIRLNKKDGTSELH